MNKIQRQIEAMKQRLAKRSPQAFPCEFWSRSQHDGSYTFECTSGDDTACIYTAGDVLTSAEFRSHIRQRRQTTPNFRSVVIETMPVGNPDQPDDNDQF